LEEKDLVEKAVIHRETKLPLSNRIVKDWRKFRAIYFLAIFGIAYYAIFCYLPMSGILIAFEDFKPFKGVFGSTWVGLKFFKDFFSSHYFWRILRNTIIINIYDVIFGFPAPIIFALLLNEVTNKTFKRSVQTISYLPYFISLVVVCGILVDFLSLNGLINQIVVGLGGQKTNFLLYPEYFRTIYVGSGIWQFLGYGAIIYLAALSGVDVQLYDAAAIDGCNRFQRVLHVTLPGILPTIVIMFILRTGSMMNVGFEKIILLYNASTYETSDVISSFIYRYGLLGGNFSYSTAVGLFNSVVNFGLLYLTNLFSRKVGSISLW
jgi:putative aldouronate transport system permease protein